jgi:hypothetical protein
LIYLIYVAERQPNILVDLLDTKTAMVDKVVVKDLEVQGT